MFIIYLSAPAVNDFFGTKLFALFIEILTIEKPYSKSSFLSIHFLFMSIACYRTEAFERFREIFLSALDKWLFL